MVWLVLVGIVTPHHAHLLQGVPMLDIGALLAQITQLVHGSTAKRMVQAMNMLFTLKKQPGTPWAAFATKVTNLHATVYRNGLPDGYQVGQNLFADAVMSACDNDPRYATALTLLRLQETTPLITEVLHQLGLVVVGDTPSTLVATGNHCFDYAKGRCHRGSNCKYRHAIEVPQGKTENATSTSSAKTRKCTLCGEVPSHKYSACPLIIAFKSSQAAATAETAAVASPTPPTPVPAPAGAAHAASAGPAGNVAVVEDGNVKHGNDFLLFGAHYPALTPPIPWSGSGGN
jgi:hypothetical protein